MTHALARLFLRYACVADLTGLPYAKACAQDIGVTAITGPVSGCAFSLNENVTVWLYNYGPAGSSFNVTYSINADYTFDATTSLPGDINPTNNTYSGYIVTNWANSVGGALATPPAGSTGTLTLTGYTSEVVQWEESDDNGARWFALANTTGTQTYSGLGTPARFRVRVRNGLCAEALSNVVTATP